MTAALSRRTVLQGMLATPVLLQVVSARKPRPTPTPTSTTSAPAPVACYPGTYPGAYTYPA